MLAGNREILAQKNTLLLTKLTSVAAASDITFMPSKQKNLIPAYRDDKTKAPPKAWYSLYDEYRDSQKFVAQLDAELNYSVVILGLGAGYQLKAFLNQPYIKKIYVIESSAAFAKTILEAINLAKVLSDDRVDLILTCHATEALEAIKKNYKPILDGTLISYSLRLSIEYDSRFYHQFQEAFRQYCRDLEHDIASQAYFGRRWFHHIVENLLNFQDPAGDPKIDPEQKVFIAGAGPSLEQALPQLLKALDGVTIIACEAALRTLTGWGIKASYIITLDAQIYVLYHLLGVLPAEDQILFADLVSPPWFKNHFKTSFYSGGHPLGLLSGVHYLDTRGANVGYAALALAYALGAKAANISLAGFDFGYPRGKTYAKNSGIYAVWQEKSSRLNPILSENLALMLGKKELMAYPLGNESNEEGYFYQTSLLAFYQKKFLNFKANAHVSQPQWPLKKPFQTNFLPNYLAGLKKLASSKQLNLTKTDYNIRLTTLPLATSFYAEYGSKALDKALNYSINFLEQKL